MNNRSTFFILGGLFIVLLIISVVQSNRVVAPPLDATTGSTLAPAEAALNQPNRIFTDFRPEDIQAFSILDPDTGATLTFIRDEDRWTSMEFGDVVAGATAETLALTVTILPYLEMLPDVKPEDYEEFGLTDEKAYLLLSVLLKDKTEHAVVIGDVLPDNNGHYALADDRTEVYALDARPIAYLVSYLRQIYLPPTETPAATATSGE